MLEELQEEIYRLFEDLSNTYVKNKKFDIRETISSML